MCSYLRNRCEEVDHLLILIGPDAGYGICGTHALQCSEFDELTPHDFAPIREIDGMDAIEWLLAQARRG